MAPHEVLPNTPENTQRLVERHKAFYEVSPHQTVLTEPTSGTTSRCRRFQTGFDIDVYGTRSGNESDRSLEYELGYRILQQIADAVLAEVDESCDIEAIPFRSSTILETKNNFGALAIIRITIANRRDEPLGRAEREGLHAIEEQLKRLGLRRALDEFQLGWCRGSIPPLVRGFRWGK